MLLDTVRYERIPESALAVALLQKLCHSTPSYVWAAVLAQKLMQDFKRFLTFLDKSTLRIIRAKNV